MLNHRKRRREERRKLIRERWERHFHELVQGTVTLAAILGYTDERLMKLAEKGLRLLRIHKLDKALKIFRGLVILDPWVPYFHYLLGSAYEKLQNAERALREYRSAVALTAGMEPAPDVVPFAVLGQARVLARSGRLEEALDALRPIAEGPVPAAAPTTHAIAKLMCRHLEAQLQGAP
jgi:tetratricopeptide (TPR) repeat protein